MCWKSHKYRASKTFLKAAPQMWFPWRNGITLVYEEYRDFLGSSVVKNLPANAGDIREADFIPGSGRSPVGGHDNLLLTWKLLCPEETPMDRRTSPPETEEPGRLQSIEKRVRHDLSSLACMHTQHCGIFEMCFNSKTWNYLLIKMISKCTSRPKIVTEKVPLLALWRRK